MSEEGEFDLEADPYDELLGQLEKQNHEACETLLAVSYNSAGLLRRSVCQVTANQTAARNVKFWVCIM